MHLPVETTERVDPMNNMAALSCIVAKVEGLTDTQKLSLHDFYKSFSQNGKVVIRILWP